MLLIILICVAGAALFVSTAGLSLLWTLLVAPLLFAIVAAMGEWSLRRFPPR